MLLLELLGMDAAPGRTKYHRTGKPNGRPSENDIRPRPAKNLWFKDDKLWKSDLATTYNNDFNLVVDEEEETVVACDRDRKMAYGKWSKKDGQGITYKTPRPLQTAIHPKKRLRDFIPLD